MSMILSSSYGASVYGYYVASIFVACVLCADDAALISPTVHGMQCLIDICSSYDAEQDIAIKNVSPVLLDSHNFLNSKKFFIDNSFLAFEMHNFVLNHQFFMVFCLRSMKFIKIIIFVP